MGKTYENQCANSLNRQFTETEIWKVCVCVWFFGRDALLIFLPEKSHGWKEPVRLQSMESAKSQTLSDFTSLLTFIHWRRKY